MVMERILILLYYHFCILFTRINTDMSYKLLIIILVYDLIRCFKLIENTDKDKYLLLFRK